MRKTYPIGTVCYVFISPFQAFEGKVIGYIHTKTDKYPWYKVEYTDKRFNSRHVTSLYELYLTFEEAKDAHDVMEKIFLNS